MDLEAKEQITSREAALLQHEALQNEMFSPADENTFKNPNEFDFLQSKSEGASSRSSLLRGSLFVKFDPLLADTKTPESTPSINEKRGCSEVRESINLLGHSSVLADTTITLDKDVKPKGEPLVTAGVMSESFEETLINDLASSDAEFAELCETLNKKEEELKLLHTQIEQKRLTQNEMILVLKQYEHTISEMVGAKQMEEKQYEADKAALEVSEKQATEDLRNVENAFSDVHRKYERSKVILEGLKANEEQLKKYMQDSKDKLIRADERFHALKSHAEEQLRKANEEIQSITRSQESEFIRLKAMLKKAEMNVSGHERTLEQKSIEIKELTSICDDLMARKTL